MPEDRNRTDSQGTLDESARKKYEKALQSLDEELRPLTDAVRDSEHLTQEDFAIRINARE